MRIVNLLFGVFALSQNTQWAKSVNFIDTKIEIKKQMREKPTSQGMWLNSRAQTACNNNQI